MNMQPIKFTDYNAAVQAFAEDREGLERDWGVAFEEGVEPLGYLPDPFRKNLKLAMDAQATLSSTPNSSIPAYFTSWFDPTIFNVLFSPNKFAKILGEQKTGDWVTDTAFFPFVESTGEVSSYGDFVENGSTGMNPNWPQRQNYIWQTMKEYGERQLARVGLAKIGLVAEIDKSAALTMGKFENLVYAFGVAGLQNYGLLNDPNLTATLSPSLKSYGGTAWFVNGVCKATANEIFTDIQSLYTGVVGQNNDLVDAEVSCTLAMHPTVQMGLTTTNSFNVNVFDLLKKNFPGMKFETAVQYGVRSASNPQGLVAGNMMQLIVDSVEGQRVGYCSFSEKMRSHPIIRGTSSFKQKVSGGAWGAVIRQPSLIGSMTGL